MDFPETALVGAVLRARELDVELAHAVLRHLDLPVAHEAGRRHRWGGQLGKVARKANQRAQFPRQHHNDAAGSPPEGPRGPEIGVVRPVPLLLPAASPERAGSPSSVVWAHSFMTSISLRLLGDDIVRRPQAEANTSLRKRGRRFTGSSNANLAAACAGGGLSPRLWLHARRRARVQLAWNPALSAQAPSWRRSSRTPTRLPEKILPAARHPAIGALFPTAQLEIEPAVSAE